MESAIPRDATKESVSLSFNVPTGSGGKRRHTICPILFQVFVRIAAYVLSLALWGRLVCSRFAHMI